MTLLGLSWGNLAPCMVTQLSYAKNHTDLKVWFCSEADIYTDLLLQQELALYFHHVSQGS